MSFVLSWASLTFGLVFFLPCLPLGVWAFVWRMVTCYVYFDCFFLFNLERGQSWMLCMMYRKWNDCLSPSSIEIQNVPLRYHLLV